METASESKPTIESSNNKQFSVGQYVIDTAVKLFKMRPRASKAFWFAFAVVLLLMSITLVVAFFYHPSAVAHKVITPTQQNAMKVQALQTQLDTISEKMDSQSMQGEQAKQALSKQLGQLSDEVSLLEHQQSSATQATNAVTMQKVNAILSAQNQSLQQKIHAVQHELDQVKRDLRPTHYASAKVLPFQVVSLDYWNGTPLLTLQMQHHVALVGLNESRAGWTVESLNMDDHSAVLENKYHRLVKVTL